MTPILALLADSVRELRAKRLFWLVLAISAMIIIGFGSIGFDEKGITMLYGLWSVESEFIHADSPFAAVMLEGIFSSIIVAYWLGWGAMILALISTAGVFPDFLSPGSIDLALSKPVSRVTMFLTKFGGSLLFVALQVLIFCVGAFLVIRYRLGEWRWALFIAVPVLVLMFSYLYAFMVFFNVVTRSTLASLLLTMLIWMGLFSIQSSEGVLNMFRIQFQQDVERHQELVDIRRVRLAQAEQRDDEGRVTYWRNLLNSTEADLASAQEMHDRIAPWHTWLLRATNVLPKTQQTVALVQRRLERDTEFNFGELMMGEPQRQHRAAPPMDPEAEMHWHSPDDLELHRRLEEDYASRSAAYIIGTSLAFEAAVLALACFIFVRRDY